MNRTPSNIFETVVTLWELALQYGPAGISMTLIAYLWWREKKYLAGFLKIGEEQGNIAKNQKELINMLKELVDKLELYIALKQK